MSLRNAPAFQSSSRRPGLVVRASRVVSAASSLAHTVPILVWAVFLGFLGTCASPLQAADYKTDILSAWKSREAKLQDAVFVVKMRTLTPKGSYNGRRGHDPATGDMPAVDTYIERRVTLYVSGDMRRFEFKGEIYDLSRQTPVSDDGVLVVQKGGEVREFFKYPHQQQTPLQGAIKTEAIPFEEPRNWPLFHFCRPLSKSLDDYAVVNLKSSGAEAGQIELATGDGTHILTVDPERDHSMVRYVNNPVRTNGPRNRWQLDVEYSPDKDKWWVPKHWVVSRYKNDKLASHCECEVESYRLDPQLDASLFTLEFPPGTHVFDMLNPDEQVRYVYLASGERKEISRDKIDRAPTRHNLSSETPPTAARHGLLYGNIALIVICSILLFLKVLFRNKAAA
jgi:hypothetical protein